MKVVGASLLVLASLFLTTSDAALTGKWPPVDKPPPPVAEWTSLVDQAKVPKAPVAKSAGSDCPPKDPFCNWSCNLCTRAESDVVKCPTKGDWGLTFDDGPTEFTNTLLDFLEAKNVKATFFVIGSRVFENPEILQKAVKNGHQIGVHTWSHTALTTQTTEEIIAEIKWTESAIKQAVGLTPKYMRPPFGDYDDRVRSIATQLGYKIVIWDKDTNDWESAEDKSYQLTWIEGNFTEWVKETSTTGHISLEHDLYKQTAERAQLVVPILQNAGFLIKPVSVCTGDSKPYVEDVSLDSSTPASTPAYSQPPAAKGTSAPYSNSNSESDTSTPSSGGMTTPTPASTNSASSNNINLLSFVFLVIGSFIFI